MGRGIAGKGGKTAGRGTKGTKARDTVKPGFEGGQLQLAQRIPKLRGFANPFRIEYNVVNLDVLDALDDDEVTPESLKAAGLVHHKGLVKVLGGGELHRAVRVSAHAFSRRPRRPSSRPAEASRWWPSPTAIAGPLLRGTPSPTARVSTLASSRLISLVRSGSNVQEI